MRKSLETAGVVAILILALSAGNGCESTEEKGNEEEFVETTISVSEDGLIQMKFDVDPSMLGIPVEIEELGLRVVPPRGWPPIPPAELDQTIAAMQEMVPEGDWFRSTPVRIFSGQDRQFFMIVAEFQNWPVPVDPFAALEDYRAHVEAAKPTAAVKERAYSLGSITVYQLLISDQVMVNTRLILIREGRLPVQVDYLVPRPAYQGAIKGIEASVGSIETL